MEGILYPLLAAIAPAIILASIILHRDRQHPEPVKWLLAAVGLGALCGPVVLIIVGTIIPVFPTDTLIGAFFNSFLDAALPEEGMKFLALYFVAKKCKHFDEMYDGIVYAVCVGMGFAGLENILYVVGAENWILTGISRALMAVPMHYVFAVIMGSFFSLGWFDAKNRRIYYSAALLLPILAHGAYDTLCYASECSPLFGLIFLIVFLVSFRYIRRYVKSLSQSMLQLDGIKS